MLKIADRINRIKPSPSSMAGQYARELKAAGKDIVGLISGEPDFDTPQTIKQAAANALAEGKTKYTDVAGTLELRTAIAAKFKRENQLDYAANEIIVSTGGKQVIFNALMCTVQAGDEVLIPAPYWVSYPDITLLAEGTPKFVPCHAENAFKLRAEDLEASITERTRWLILNAPNNPSGALYTEQEMRALTDVLLRHPQVWVMTDDIYEHIVYDQHRFVTPAQVEPQLKDRTLTINGVSKAYAMTGWRIGYAGGPAALIKAMVKLQSQSTSNPSTPAQAGALEALTGPQDFPRESRIQYQVRRDYVVERLNAITGIQCHCPEGAFYVFPRCSDLFGAQTPAGKVIANSDDFVIYLLEEVGLAVLQGSAYGVDEHFRISFATSMQTLREGCDRLEVACSRLKLG